MMTNPKCISGDDVIAREEESVDLNVALLTTTKHEPKSIEVARKYMVAAAYSNGPKRGPILVRKNGEEFIVVDGNATTNAARILEIESLPANVIKTENDQAALSDN